MINGHGARSNDPDESSVAVDDGDEMLVDEKFTREHARAIRQDSDRRQVSGWLHGSGPGRLLLAWCCPTDLQVSEGVHLRPGSGVSVESYARLRIRCAEVDGEESVQDSR